MNDLFVHCLYDFFRNLYCICCRTLTNIVSDNPKIYAVFYAFIAADTSDEYFVLACCGNSHRVFVVCAVILYNNTGCIFQNLNQLIQLEGLFKFHVDGFAVRIENRYTNRCCRHAHSVVMQNLSGFVTIFISSFV